MENSSGKQQYGRYQTIKLLGRGSMSTVHKAIDPLLGREVAIKVIHPQLCRQPGFIKRFEREAMALARLDHPNVIDIYDMGHEKDVFYMVIRFLSGGTLKECLQPFKQNKKFMTLQQVNRIFSGICQAVDYIHRAGFVHRDLKPSNIMFDEQDKPILADFGIVKAMGWESFTVQGGILGTPFYMSPEQFSGVNVDLRSDIYSLGVMLYEMCTSNLPFRGSVFADIVRAQLKQDPVLPEQINPTIPPAASAVILKALAKSPDHRYQSARELAEAFSATLPLPYKEPTKDTIPISEPNNDLPSAYLKSSTSGLRYKLSTSIDNRIGRSKPNEPVEIDLSAEKDSDFVHSIHAIVRYTPSGWELATPDDIENPVLINTGKIGPGERVILSHGDRVTFSLTKLEIEIE